MTYGRAALPCGYRSWFGQSGLDGCGDITASARAGPAAATSEIKSKRGTAVLTVCLYAVGGALQ
jgi:hypothetical protein